MEKPKVSSRQPETKYKDSNINQGPKKGEVARMLEGQSDSYEIRRNLESLSEKQLVECLESLKGEAVEIGEGQNSNILSVEEGRYFDFCVKKLKKIQMMRVNPLEQEFKFQQRVLELGITTPQTVAVLRNERTEEEFVIMERVHGSSLGDIMIDKKPVPENYNHSEFFKKLREMIKKMHQARIHHRDLHEGNVMINEEGDPVIIDFGTAGYEQGDDQETYSADQVLKYDEKTGKYEVVGGLLPKDEDMLNTLEYNMRKKTSGPVITYDQFGNPRVY